MNVVQHRYIDRNLQTTLNRIQLYNNHIRVWPPNKQYANIECSCRIQKWRTYNMVKKIIVITLSQRKPQTSQLIPKHRELAATMERPLRYHSGTESWFRYNSLKNMFANWSYAKIETIAEICISKYLCCQKINYSCVCVCKKAVVFVNHRDWLCICIWTWRRCQIPAGYK